MQAFFRTSVAVSISLLSLIHVANGQEWTRFRGPNGSGISESKTVPVEWSESDYNWKTELPGIGHGSPVVWGNRLFVNAETDDGAARMVVCLDTNTGDRLWEKSFNAGTHKKHRKNSYASSTPAVDENHVYVAWATPKQLTLTALDHEGNVVWEDNLGRFKGGHGFACSPIVYNNMVILGNDQDGESTLIAADCKTGKVRWNVPRNSDRTTYSTPCVYERAGRKPELIFTNWRHGITAIDPETGKTNWELSVFDQSHSERAIGSPIVAGDMVIGSCGFTTAQKHVVGVRPGESGKSDDVVELIRIERSVPHIPSVLAFEDLLYLWNDKGIVTCHTQKDGKVVWQKRVGGNYFGSPVVVDGKIYSVDDKGTVVVLAAGEKFQELARNELGEGSHSTPAVANGTMFIRSFSHVYAIGGQK